MKKRARIYASLCSIVLSIIFLTDRSLAQPAASPLTLSNAAGATIHYFPTVTNATARAAAAFDSGPLLYNGGRIMPMVAIYAIFWMPAALQDGSATGMSSQYQTIQQRLLTDYVGHAISGNNTQYYQQNSTNIQYFQNRGRVIGVYVDNSPYPPSDCVDSLTPGGCVSDNAVQAEILKVMSLNGWTGGLDKVFFLYTSSGEGSCFSGTTVCSYTLYCAYHGYIRGMPPIIYANEPYGEPNFCQVGGTPSPNDDAAADTAATSSSHELSEMITDPLLNAWITASGNEIGDLCAYNYGANTWNGGHANQVWNGNPYELQTEFDNHTGSCVQLGP